MKWINAEQQVTVSIYDDEHEEYLDKIMTVEEMLDTYTNEGCPTIYSNPEQTRWIPVSERLPKDEQKVLVTTRSGKLIDVDTSIYYHASAYWEHYVIAWMPLPEPYKAESEE